MTKEEYILLYEKYQAGQCNADERKRFEAHIDQLEFHEEPWDNKQLGDEQALADRMYQRLHASLERKRSSSWQLWQKFSAAAVVLITVTAGYYYLGPESARPLPRADQASAQRIRPGSKQAVLTLDDGSTILLKSSTTGIVASQGSTEIRRNADGQIVYTRPAGMDGSNSRELSNKISTPRGGETQICLPDGTKVWLNAASSLKFPTIFSGNQRRVELSGEAYMEVAENKQLPFIVSAGGTEVEVLGTRFNINAYQESGAIKATLLQGAIKFKNKNHDVRLKPGEEGIAATNGKLQVRAANLADVMAWKNGLFIFQNESIQKIMTEAARWYNIDVEYIGGVEELKFDAILNRSENISELLKNMELTGTVQFKIKGRRVTVMAK